MARILPILILVIAIALGLLFAIDPHINIRIKLLHYSLKAFLSISALTGIEPLEKLAQFTPTIPPGKGSDGITSVDLVIPPLPSSVVEGITPVEPVPVRIHYPGELQGKFPILINFHGGGLCLGNATSFVTDQLSRRFAREGPYVVVSVDYRLAPKYPLPAAIDDSLAAVIWAATSSHSILKDYGDSSKLILLGDSGGGYLVATVAQHISKNHPEIKIAAQVLIYPSLGLIEQQTESSKKYKNGYVLFEELSLMFEKARLRNNSDFRKSVFYQPLRAPNLAGLPRAHFVLANFDRLFDYGVLYFNALKNAGVPVSMDTYDSVHGFFTMDFLLEADKAQQDVLRILKETVQSSQN